MKIGGYFDVCDLYVTLETCRRLHHRSISLEDQALVKPQPFLPTIGLNRCPYLSIGRRSSDERLTHFRFQ